MTGNVQLYLPERTGGPVRMGGPLVGFGWGVKSTFRRSYGLYI
jgi:hypothetical protein